MVALLSGRTVLSGVGMLRAHISTAVSTGGSESCEHYAFLRRRALR